jgi:hypothetical protein
VRGKFQHFCNDFVDDVRVTSLHRVDQGFLVLPYFQKEGNLFLDTSFVVDQVVGKHFLAFACRYFGELREVDIQLDVWQHNIYSTLGLDLTWLGAHHSWAVRLTGSHGATSSCSCSSVSVHVWLDHGRNTFVFSNRLR